MNSWDDIKEKCPKLFKHGCAFECGKGWYFILENLCKKIEEILERSPMINKEDEVFEFDMYVEQIKEKYGELRFYMSVTTKEIDELVEEAYEASKHTCEVCGKLGKMLNNKWYMVRCETCGDK